MEYFIARQPVFLNSKSVFGYELLFRNGLENCCTSLDGDSESLDVLATTLFHTPFLDMAGSKRGLVNFTRKVLLSEMPYLFAKDQLVIEILETVVPDEQVVAACTRLKRAGYTLALDDFVADDLQNPLLHLADIVKVDFIHANHSERRLIANRLLPRKTRLLAEKVETYADFREAENLGYELYQGYFFSKPVIRTMHHLAPNGMACLRMLQTIARDDFTFEELDDIVKSDVSLSYRVLKLVNSPLFSFRPNITSTLHALRLLGRDHIRRFIAIIALNLLGSGKTSELVLTSVIRARLAEGVAPAVGLGSRASEFFLAGLFSLMDAMLDRPMTEVIEGLPVSQDIRTALLGGDNVMRFTLDMIIAYQTADWAGLAHRAGRLGFDQDALPRMYAASIAWADALLQERSRA
jgi:c-di-GMP-related signal transduction protein